MNLFYENRKITRLYKIFLTNFLKVILKVIMVFDYPDLFSKYKSIPV